MFQLMVPWIRLHAEQCLFDSESRVILECPLHAIHLLISFSLNQILLKKLPNIFGSFCLSAGRNTCGTLCHGSIPVCATAKDRFLFLAANRMKGPELTANYLPEPRHHKQRMEGARGLILQAWFYRDMKMAILKVKVYNLWWKRYYTRYKDVCMYRRCIMHLLCSNSWKRKWLK